MEVFTPDKSSSSECAAKDRRFWNDDLDGGFSYNLLNFHPETWGRWFPFLQTCFNSVAPAPLNITFLRGDESILEILPPTSIANAYILRTLNLSWTSPLASPSSQTWTASVGLNLYSLLVYDHGKKGSTMSAPCKFYQLMILISPFLFGVK